MAVCYVGPHPLEISHRLLPQSWCWLQMEQPRDEPFTFCEETWISCSQGLPCVDSGEFHTKPFWG